MTLHPDYLGIKKTIRSLVSAGTKDWNGLLFRNVKPKYSDAVKLTDGMGAFKNGSRWSSPGLDRVVYGSTDNEGAFAEFSSHVKRSGLPTPAADYNRDTRVFHVQLHCLLDLTGPTALPSLGIDPLDLLAIPWQAQQTASEEAITQAVGRAVYSLGVEAILVPCAPEPTRSNVVIYLSNLDPRSRIAAVPI